MKRNPIPRRESANAIVLALLFVVVLSGIAGTSYRILNQRYRQVHQTASWQEALLAAESGVDLAVSEVRKTLVDESSAWQGWVDENGNASSDPQSSEIQATSTVLLRTGEGGDRSWTEVTVDAPSFLIDASGEQWYRVRSLGVAEVPGGAVAVGNSADLNLRKFDLVMDRRTEKAVPHPQAARLIEAIVKPIGTFQLAILGIDTIDLNNHNIKTVSYDSRIDPTAAELADPTVVKLNTPSGVRTQRENADIATNGQLLEAGSAHVYGDASTNGGDVLNAENVTGTIRDDFYQDILTVTSPTLAPDANSPTSVNNTTIIAASTSKPGTGYVLSSINLSGEQTLRIQGDPEGGETFVQIVVTGDISLTGKAAIVLDEGVYVRIFLEGDANISGNGVSNPNPPLNFQLFGVSPPTDPDDPDATPPAPGEIKIAGNGEFHGGVYAPNYNVTMVGGGQADSVYGAFAGKTVTMTGVQTVHYDEALADGGLIADYRVASWFEDVR